MRFMVQMLDDTATWDADMAKFGPDDVRATLEYMGALNAELSGSGELVEVRGLAGPGAALTVTAVAGGEHKVTEGPHDPNGRILSGYWVIDVKDKDRAVEIAGRLSAAPGPGGQPYNAPVELHFVPEEPASA